MPNAAFSIAADILDDGHYAITATQTGLDTLSLNVREWPLGTDYTAPPATENTYACTDVRVTGEKLTCVTSAPLLQKPTIEVELSPPQNLPSAMISIGHTWWSNFTKVLPLTAADYAGAQKFYADAKFPIGT